MNKMILAPLATLLCFAGTASADDVLKIGAPISKTGWNAPYDSPVLDGFAVAIDEINAAGGIAGKYKVEIETRDNRSDNAQNAIVTQELIDQGVQLPARDLRFQHGACDGGIDRHGATAGDLDLLVLADAADDRQRLHLRQRRHR